MRQVSFWSIFFAVIFIIIFIDTGDCKERTDDELYIAAKEMYKLGNEKWNVGKAEQADKAMNLGLSFLKQALEKKPNEPRYLRLACNLLVALGKEEEALKKSNTILSIEPAKGENYDLRASIFLLLNKTDKAFSDYRKAIELAPDNFYIYTNYCSALDFIGKYDEAVEVCTKSLKINPNYALAYYFRARAYEGLVKMDLAKRDDEKAKSLGFKKIKDRSINLLEK